MPEIYSRASMVLVWLGVAFEDESNISEYADNGSDAFMDHIDSYTSIPDDERSKSVPWAQLAEWENLFNAHTFSALDYLDNLIRRHEKRSTKPYARSWSDAFEATKRSKCSDPRDHIYGLLGLVDSEYRIPVDYTKSLEEALMMAMRKEAGNARLDQFAIKSLVKEYNKRQAELDVDEEMRPDQIANIIRDGVMMKRHPDGWVMGRMCSGEAWTPACKRDFDEVTEYLKYELLPIGKHSE